MVDPKSFIYSNVQCCVDLKTDLINEEATHLGSRSEHFEFISSKTIFIYSPRENDIHLLKNQSEISHECH